MMQDASGSFGIRVDDPEWIEVSHEGGQQKDGIGYVKHLDPKFPFKSFKVAVVVIHDARHKKAIKTHLD